MESARTENDVIRNYRKTPLRKILFVGKYSRCWHAVLLTKSFLFKKSWIDSSGKDQSPPDFHNDKHRIMMEVMKIDDCVSKNKGNIPQKIDHTLKRCFGEEYEEKLKDVTLFFNPDTRDSKKFNINGYFKSFERVFLNHSKKVPTYHNNYKKCKTCVLFVYDESNSYIQVTDKSDIGRSVPQNKYKIHYCYLDKKFLSLIKSTEADFVIWMGVNKSITVNGKPFDFPMACVYDVKNINIEGIEYDYSLMSKVI